LPDDKPLEVGSPVKEFVSDFLIQFNDGIKDQGFRTCSEASAEFKFELNVTQVKTAEGGIKAHIFNAGGKRENTNSQKIIAYAKRVHDYEEAETKARIATAKAKELAQVVEADRLTRNYTAAKRYQEKPAEES